MQDVFSNFQVHSGKQIYKWKIIQNWTEFSIQTNAWQHKLVLQNCTKYLQNLNIKDKIDQMLRRCSKKCIKVNQIYSKKKQNPNNKKNQITNVNTERLKNSAGVKILYIINEPI